MRLRRWRVVASVRVFPGSSCCRSLPAAAVFLFVSVAPAVHACCLVLLGVLSFLAPAASVGGSGSSRCRFVCSARSVSLRRRSAPAWTFGDHLRSISAAERCCCEHSTGHRDHRGALSPRSGRVSFAQRCHRHSSGGTLTRRGSPGMRGQFNRGSVAPGKVHWVDTQRDLHPSPAWATQPWTDLAGGNRLVPLQRSWGLEPRGRVNTFPAGGLPPQVRASLLPQAHHRRTFSGCRTHHC